MYVGTLTADEIVYAGSTFIDTNPDYYLINYYQKSNDLQFWSSSVFSYDGMAHNDIAHCVSKDNYNNYGYNYITLTSSNYNFRPAINLKSGTLITGGDGTKTNAYTILTN